MDFVQDWSAKTDIAARQLITWLGIGPSKFYAWRHRYGKANEHNGCIPRDFWLEPWERQAIIDYFHKHPAEGYRRLGMSAARTRRRDPRTGESRFGGEQMCRPCRAVSGGHSIPRVLPWAIICSAFSAE